MESYKFNAIEENITIFYAIFIVKHLKLNERKQWYERLSHFSLKYDAVNDDDDNNNNKDDDHTLRSEKKRLKL